MIPILYESNETSFTTNGIGRLSDIVSGKVTEELNGVYECEFTYPINGKYFDEIIEGRIIACYHDDTRLIQPFEIYSRSQLIDNNVTFYAHHISYKLNGIVLNTPFRATSCAQAMSMLNSPNYTMNDCPFTFWTDIESTGELNIEVPTTVRQMMGNEEENSILKSFTVGEYEFDKFSVKLHLHRGLDRDVSIRYGKNLTEFNYDTDISESYDAVAPFWKGSVYDGDTEESIIVKLPNGYIVATEVEEQYSSPSDRNYARISPLDLSSEFEDPPTVAQLEAKAREVLEGSKAWLVKENFEISFDPVWTYDEYNDYSALQRVSLCDKVTVYNPNIPDLEIKMEVIKTTYDFVLEKYESMELGSPKKDFVTSLTESILTVTDTLIEDLPTKSFLDAAISHATELISGGLGGYLVIKTNASGQPEELLIMDTPDIETAVKIWRFNMGGLGYSSNGYNGDFSLAITMDGRIVADFVNTGVLNARIITAGILSDRLSNNWWNLETGEMHISSSAVDVEVGGTNLILGSKDMPGNEGEARWNVYPTSTCRIENGIAYLQNGGADNLWSLRGVTGKKIKDYMNRYITFSFDYYIETAADNLDLRVQLNLRSDPYSSQLNTGYKQINIPASKIVVGKKQRLSVTYLPTGPDYFYWYPDKEYSGEYYISFRISAGTPSDGTVNAQISRCKAEVGNVPTDWSPAPEDIDNGMAEINQQYMSISADVSGIQTQVGTISQGLNGVEQQYSTLSQTVGEISSTVVDMKQIGTTNLLLRSEDMYDQSSDQSGNARWEASPVDTSYISNGRAHLIGKASNQYLVSIAGATEEYIRDYLYGNVTISFDAWIGDLEDKNDINVYLLLNTTVDNVIRKTYGWKSGSIAASNLAVNRTHRLSISFSLTDQSVFTFASGKSYNDNLLMGVMIEGTAKHDLQITKIKMEKGVVATDWGPSPKDIDEGLDDLDLKYSTISQTVNDITFVVGQKVGKSEVISSINMSSEQIAINSNKISFSGNTVDFSASEVMFHRSDWSGTTRFKYAESTDIRIVPYIGGMPMYPVLLGGLLGYLRLGYEDNRSLLELCTGGNGGDPSNDILIGTEDGSAANSKIRIMSDRTIEIIAGDYALEVRAGGIYMYHNGTVIDQWT